MGIFNYSNIEDSIRIASEISDSTEDYRYDPYNRSLNESTEEYVNAVTKTSKLRNEVDLDGLLNDVNSLLEGIEPKGTKMAKDVTGNVELKVGDAGKSATSQKSYVDGKLKDSEKIADSWKKDAESKKEFAKGDEKQTEVDIATAKSKEVKTPSATLKTATKGVTESTTVIEKPKAIKQDAPKPQKDATSAEPAPKSVANVSAKQSQIEKMKKDAFPGGKQNVPKEVFNGTAKFESFVTSLKDEKNSVLIESIMKAFYLTH